ncbi:MAG: PIG-L family deacetylase [Candidatus Eiseniibacteriota bacterium]
MRRMLLATFLAILLVPPAAFAHPEPAPPADGARLRLALEKLGVTGSVLFVAAHPDDENTALLAWLANGRKVRTAYLSVTRGDGGQNLIGPDTGELLGVIRTNELLAARRIDGAEQFFTRALDFGFSKNPDETLAIWDRERILSDVVYVIRRFRPDVIVTRFPVDGGGHGHHTASAILAEEAFSAAADPKRFPEQLDTVKPWQAKRLMWNVFRFGNAPPDTVPDRARVDIGAYDPLLGRSYSEIAGESRSQHKSQGFGSLERRGSFVNSFDHRLGERAKNDLFDGVDLTWARYPGGEKIQSLFEQAAREYRPHEPASVAPLLLRARTALAALPNDPIVVEKRAELDEALRASLGLWIEAIATVPGVEPGARVRIATTALNRSTEKVSLSRVEIVGAGTGASVPSGGAQTLVFNQPANDTILVAIPEGRAPTRPYWLERPALRGSFDVADPSRIGDPENAPELVARFTFAARGQSVVLETPVVHRWVDPVAGERYRDFQIVPLATLRFDRTAYLFPDASARDVRVVVEPAPAAQAVDGRVRLRVPEGWRVSPPEAAVAFLGSGPGRDTTLTFRVAPGASASGASARVAAEFESGGHTYGLEAVTLDYPHIPLQRLHLPAAAKLVRADLKIAGGRIGYVMGSGDDVPEALEQMGVRTVALSDEDLENADLSAYDAIVTGVRAYNTRPRLRAQQKRLLDYVAHGGRLVVQYNTAEEALQDRLGPAPFRISRDRVTVEEAPVRVLKPEHPLVTTPNRITDQDFAGWVQERGLYFANPWDPSYETVLSSNDPGEPARDGGVLYARHGRGVFIYSAYAWFRELPAGVPGAWRLFANLVSTTPIAP